MQVNVKNNAAAPEFFVSQWGYEQTNVCFYKVLKRTAKMITILAVRSNRNYIDGVNYEAVPVDESPAMRFCRPSEGVRSRKARNALRTRIQARNATIDKNQEDIKKIRKNLQKRKKVCIMCCID